MQIIFHNQGILPLRPLFEYCAQLLQELYGDLPETIHVYSTSSCRKYGSCRVQRSGRQANIRINKALLQNQDMAKNTILHELLHARKACIQVGHKGEWARAAEEVTALCQLRYPIQRISQALELTDTRPLLQIRCQKCHNTFTTKSKAMQTKYTRYYRCAHCKGKLVTV